MKLPSLILFVSAISSTVVMSRTLNYSDVYKFCAGLCNSIDESRDTNKLLICQRKCHDGMIEEGFANGHTKKLPRKHFKKRRGIFNRAKKMIFKPVRYVYRKFVPRQSMDYDTNMTNN